MPMAALEATERASIDSQISTAKRYPRSMERFKNNAVSMATIDEETAESCLYRRPVGKENGQPKFAEGMSIRMAEIVGASYGNMRVQATLIEQTPRFVRARGMAIDLENNFASSSEVVESTVDKNGNPYSERMRVVIAKSALAKARRDATFQVVPKALAKPVESAVRKLLHGDALTIEKRRGNVVAWISKLGIDPKRVYAALAIQGEADLNVEKLEELTGIRTAIRDNEVTIDEAFPASVPSKGLAETLDEAKSASKKPAAVKQTGNVVSGDQAGRDINKPKPEVPVSEPGLPASNRPGVISGIESHMLALGISEAKVWDYALKTFPAETVNAEKLWDLPTELLAKIKDATPGLAVKS